MIDIHTHILPGLDDGPRTIEEALEMAMAAAKCGSHTLIATPHINYEVYPNQRETILAATASLERTLREQDIPLRVLPGSEVRIHPELVQRLKSGELLTLNDGGKYLLVEYPFDKIPPCAEKVLIELQELGVTPILAHPERNRVFAHEPILLVKLVQMGVLLQITAGSIVGKFGSTPARAARWILQQNLVHFIATDMHDVAGRGPETKKALALTAGLVGKEQVRYLTSINAKCVIRGVDLPREKLQAGSVEDPVGIMKVLRKVLRK